MAVNPNKKKCTATNKAGLPCAAWAMPGSDHCRRHRTDLAPYKPGGSRSSSPHNRAHGLYSRHLTVDDTVEMTLLGGSATLEDEIAFTRVVVRRLAWKRKS